MTELTGLSALERLGEQFERLEADPPRRRPSGRVLAIAAAVIAVLVAASLTPPGRAVAGKIGELVGIGDEPTGVPQLGNDQAVVIGVGETPSGGSYEIYAHTGLAAPGDPTPITCIRLNLPNEDGPYRGGGGSCLTDENEQALERQPILPVATYEPLGVDRAITVQGLASEAVADVELEYNVGEGTSAVPVQLFTLDDALSQSIESSETGKFFIGLLPAAEILPQRAESIREVEDAFLRVRISAIGESGEVLLSERYADLPLPSWWASVFEVPDKHGALTAPPPGAVREDVAN